ncbi:hypothetical protein CTEN210_12761 [Chaetoceros tenuissimus]|uniref:Uncharacterized protein n=1 Tax=Chaetoceros tenuissimus TaxID=426638 RepID=A0AAD3HAE2_9STRA|nr:hypothetical protein CTEN210_12761 [Chaetoceros tenuissimus]
MVIIGDTEGGDKLCGRYLSNKSNSLTRDCNILTSESDDPFAECSLNLHNAMKDLKLDEDRTEELQSRSFHKIDNFAFEENIFDSPFGIYGATPVEPLHLIYGGIADRVFECFEELLGKDQFKHLDRRACILSGYYSRQNCSSSFRLISKFHKGLKLKGTMSSREKVDRIFLVYLVLLCPSYRNYLEQKTCWKKGVAFSRNEYELWVHLFERTVVYCRWVRLSEYPCKLFVGKTDSIAYRCIQNYLNLVRHVGDRQKGNGFKIPKFHLNLHVPFYIAMYGSPNVISTETTERHHIELTKKPARNTQQRDSTIIEQATSRVHEKIILETFIEKKTCIVDTDDVEEDVCAAYELYLDYDRETCIFQWRNEKYERECRRSMPLLLLKQLFGVISSQKCSSANHRVYRISGLTSIRYKVNGDRRRVRSHPWYYKDQWYDWITYNWEQDEGGTLPCKVYALLDFSSCKEQTVRESRAGWNELNDREGIHMLVHSASSVVRNVRSSISCSVESKLVKEYKMENNMQIIPFDREKIEPVLCVQDWDGNVLDGVPTFNMIPNRNNVLALRNVDDWNSLFVDILRKDPIQSTESYRNTSFIPSTIIQGMKRRGMYNKEDWDWEDIRF